MKITINKTLTDGGKENVVIALAGRLDTIASQECANEWAQITTYAKDSIVLDMAQLEYIASSGLRMLLTLRKDVQNEGGQLQLKAPNAEIMQILKMTGCKDMFCYSE